MVRTYKRKMLPPSYSKEGLDTAVKNVKSGWVILYRAAKLYKIPKAASFKYVKEVRGVKCQAFVRPIAPSFQEGE